MKSFLGCVAVLALTFFLLSFSSLVYDRGHWESLQEKYGVNMTKAQPLNGVILSYFKDTNYFSGPTYPGLTEKEQQHMLDVKKRVNVIMIFSLIFCATSFFILKLSTNRKKLLIAAGIAAFLLPLLFFIFPFESTFLRFHQLFFHEGSFWFEPGDLLVNIYPKNFFADFAFGIVVRAWMLAALSLVIGLFLYRKKN